MLQTTGAAGVGSAKRVPCKYTCEELTVDGWKMADCCEQCHKGHEFQRTTRTSDSKEMLLCCRAYGWSPERGYLPTTEQLMEEADA